MAKRPRDVTYVGWCEVLSGLTLLLLCLYSVLSDLNGMQSEGFGLILGLLFSPLGVMSVIAGNLLLRLRPVGRLLSLGVLPALLFFVLAMSLPAILRTERPLTIGHAMVILVPVLLVIAFGYSYALLRRSHVKAQFVKTALHTE